MKDSDEWRSKKAYYERKAEAEYDFLWLEKYDCARWED